MGARMIAINLFQIGLDKPYTVFTYDSVMKRQLCPCCSPLKGHGVITPSFYRSPASLKLTIMLLCKGTCSPVSSPFSGQGEAPPSCSPVSASLVAFGHHTTSFYIFQMPLGFPHSSIQDYKWVGEHMIKPLPLPSYDLCTPNRISRGEKLSCSVLKRRTKLLFST